MYEPGGHLGHVTGHAYIYSQTPTPAFVGPVIINFHSGLNYLFAIKNIHSISILFWTGN